MITSSGSGPPEEVAFETISQYNCPICSAVVAYVVRRYRLIVVEGGKKENTLCREDGVSAGPVCSRTLPYNAAVTPMVTKINRF